MTAVEIEFMPLDLQGPWRLVPGSQLSKSRLVQEFHVAGPNDMSYTRTGPRSVEQRTHICRAHDPPVDHERTAASRGVRDSYDIGSMENDLGLLLQNSISRCRQGQRGDIYGPQILCLLT